MLLIGTQLESKRNYRSLFKGLNFGLDTGQLLLVEGLNGSGKTTLLKIISGLRQPENGQVIWKGNPINSEYQHHITWLGHTNGIKDDLTALENLRMMQSIHPPIPNPSPARGEGGKGPPQPKAVLERMGLAGHSNRFPRHFSAGMKRRLALCRLLLSTAPLWILDEPQAALDKAGIHLFETLLEEHLAGGGSVVMTSHHDVGLKGQHIRHLSLAS